MVEIRGLAWGGSALGFGMGWWIAGPDEGYETRYTLRPKAGVVYENLCAQHTHTPKSKRLRTTDLKGNQTHENQAHPIILIHDQTMSTIRISLTDQIILIRITKYGVLSTLSGIRRDTGYGNGNDTVKTLLQTFL